MHRAESGQVSYPFRRRRHCLNRRRRRRCSTQPARASFRSAEPSLTFGICPTDLSKTYRPAHIRSSKLQGSRPDARFSRPPRDATWPACRLPVPGRHGASQLRCRCRCRPARFASVTCTSLTFSARRSFATTTTTPGRARFAPPLPRCLSRRRAPARARGAREQRPAT